MEYSGFFEQQRKIDLMDIDLHLFGRVECPFKVAAFKVHNFKAFADTDWIYINKLTLFLGDNSAGKSVLYQVIRLLKSCYEALNQERYFTDFGGVKEVVGRFEDAHNKNTEEKAIEFSFLLKCDDENEKNIVYKVQMIPSINHEYGYVSSVTLESTQLRGNLLEYYDSQNLFFLRRKQGVEVPLELETLVKQAMDALRTFASEIRTISYHRHIPKRQMTFTGSTKEFVDIDGSDAYEMLIQLASSDPSREQKIKAWLKKFGYSYYWEAIDKNIGAFLLVNEKTGKSSNIVDNGLGISQSLPIAVELSDLKGKNVLIDTPEAFLQTRMQSEMGDLLIEGAKTGNVLAETGSEYVVLRIQRRIAEKVINVKDVTLYFIYDEKEEGNTVCRMLEMNSYGEFVNMPEEFKFFFSSDYFDMKEMSKIRIEQMRKEQNADCDRLNHMD